MAAYSIDERGIIVSCENCGQRNRLRFDRMSEAVKCGQCKRELAGLTSPVEIPTTADFDRLISSSSVPVVVDYWAPWCGPCRMVAPELAKVAARAGGRFIVAKVNTDELGDVGERFGIRSIPTMAVFAGGREVSRTTGARPAADIETFVANAIAPLHQPR
jgi:thioredoxin 2